MVNRVIHGRDPTGKGNPRSIFLNGASLSALVNATMKGGGGIFINFFKQEYFSFFFFISYKNAFFLQSERLCKRIIIIIIIIKYAMLSHPWDNCKLSKRNTDRGIVFFSPEFHRIHSRIFFFSRRRKSSLLPWFALAWRRVQYGIFGDRDFLIDRKAKAVLEAL